jgi:hypothetical protein
MDAIPSCTTDVFRKCMVCGKTWANREEFLEDPQLMVGGYIPHFQELQTGLFLLHHTTCRNTLSVPASVFRDLYDGTVFTERRTGKEDCPGYCLRKDELRPCSAHCECAYVRAILDKIAHWKKKA